MDISERLARETGRDYAYRVLRDNIITLNLAPGSMVSENELATQLHLSRTPVREALIDLAKVRIVEIYPQRGSCIALIDYQLVEQARFLRDVVEVAVVRELCHIATPELLQGLEENLKLQEYYLASGTTEHLWKLDNQFHEMLYILASKHLIYQMSSSLTVHFDRVRSMSLVAVKDNKTVSDHRAIYEALLLRDEEAAARALEKHLSRYRIDEAAIREKYPAYFK